MRRRRLRLGLLAAVAIAIGGCDWYYNDVPSPDDLWYIIPWFDHMLASPAVYPYESGAVPRNTVDRTVPVGGGEPDYLDEWRTGNTTTADQLVNPLAAGAPPELSRPGPAVPILPASVEARGDSTYQTYCAVCHGTSGAGDGPVGPKIGAPSLLTDRARGYTDGYIYSIIRYGRGVMPRYGDKIYAPLERWAVVNHVRKLQRQAAGQSAATSGGSQ